VICFKSCKSWNQDKYDNVQPTYVTKIQTQPQCSACGEEEETSQNLEVETSHKT